DRFSKKCSIQKLDVNFIGNLSLTDTISSLINRIVNSSATRIDIDGPEIADCINEIFTRSFIFDLLKEKEIVNVKVYCRALKFNDIIKLREQVEKTARVGLLSLKIDRFTAGELEQEFMAEDYETSGTWMRQDCTRESSIVNTIVRCHSTFDGDCFHVFFYKKSGWESRCEKIETLVEEILTGDQFCDEKDYDYSFNTPYDEEDY
ncbi:hypothetical protein PFISCL1PPCAC_18941, partial [Pristionchus fissidentatus]